MLLPFAVGQVVKRANPTRDARERGESLPRGSSRPHAVPKPNETIVVGFVLRASVAGPRVAVVARDLLVSTKQLTSKTAKSNSIR